MLQWCFQQFVLSAVLVIRRCLRKSVLRLKPNHRFWLVLFLCPVHQEPLRVLCRGLGFSFSHLSLRHLFRQLCVFPERRKKGGEGKKVVIMDCDDVS